MTEKDRMRAETEALVRKARYGKAKLRITRCPEMERGNLNPRRGGILPAHLDPRCMTEAEDVQHVT